MLTSAAEYLSKRHKENPNFTFEIIIVDDGSSDKTCKIAMDFSKTFAVMIDPIYSAQHPNNIYNPRASIRVLKLEHNLGKGGAVQQGVLHARGQYILFSDADGATQFSCFADLETQIQAPLAQSKTTTVQPFSVSPSSNAGVKSPSIVIGSRAHLQEPDSTAKRTALRTFLMHGFHACVSIIGGVNHVRDTQCGFKLFTREAALCCFGNQRIYGWCFDVELLFLAKRFGFGVVEIPVNWVEIDGSKVDLATASLSMLRDLFALRIAYTFGIWRVENDRELRNQSKTHTWEVVLDS